MQIEFFIHGALCVSYSGQCYISHAFTNRSANRGSCSQMCRLPCNLKTRQGKY
ncbi:U32 family peptidase [Photobacterium damselae subsp. piscicida]|nr:U32 family peptidase [Photobacterium damselae subsp. piscicida]MDP2532203.1 U32 family peptidase [Photobacterium damselae subsp. piscicida]MDP2544152.1 U32 family peptidase [Photobacterium damselae subsp. piscicida]MDP2569058.1 U32 family peptidase [Photobacterium damselae subsp. piscicida]